MRCGVVDRVLLNAGSMLSEAAAKGFVEDGDGEPPKHVAEEFRALLAGGKLPGGGGEADEGHDDFRADLDGEAEEDAHAEGDYGEDLGEEAVGSAHKDAEGEVDDERDHGRGGVMA